MKKYSYTAIVFLLAFTSCNSQRLSERQLKKINDREDFVNQKVMYLNNLDYDMNNCTSIPDFFKDVDFDRDVGGKFWLSMYATISLRKIIIDKITNRGLLECVLKSNNKDLRKNTPIPENAGYSYNKIPYQEYSAYDLVKLRIEELENIQKMGKHGNIPK